MWKQYFTFEAGQGWASFTFFWAPSNRIHLRGHNTNKWGRKSKNQNETSAFFVTGHNLERLGTTSLIFKNVFPCKIVKKKKHLTFWNRMKLKYLNKVPQNWAEVEYLNHVLQLDITTSCTQNNVDYERQTAGSMKT